MSPIFAVSEAGAAVLFLAAAWLAVRRGRLPLLELLSAAAFGLLLEQANQVIFETYEYSPDFVLAIDRAPVVIGLTWALIIVGAMRISDAFGVRARYAPFVDSVLAIMLDLAFDAVAIRIGLWTWRGIGPEQGWFGVPAGNFYSWLFVTLGFSLFTRLARAAARRHPAREWLQLLVPIPAFGLLIAAIGLFSFVKPILDPAPGGGLAIFWAALGCFVAISAWAILGPERVARRRRAEAPIDLGLAFGARLAIHALFLAALLWLGLATSAPILLGVALAMLAAEWPLVALARRRHATLRA